jgi:hypothetical protein
MNSPAQGLRSLCKQISLNLHQGNTTVAVRLLGDIIQRDCLIISSSLPFDLDKPARLSVNFFEQTLQMNGVVEKCTHDEDLYTITFRMPQQDKLETRMLLQVSEIEQYRHYLLAKGRDVSIDEAACEWVTLFAEDFASEFDAEH